MPHACMARGLPRGNHCSLVYRLEDKEVRRKVLSKSENCSIGCLEEASETRNGSGREDKLIAYRGGGSGRNKSTLSSNQGGTGSSSGVSGRKYQVKR